MAQFQGWAVIRVEYTLVFVHVDRVVCSHVCRQVTVHLTDPERFLRPVLANGELRSLRLAWGGLNLFIHCLGRRGKLSLVVGTVLVALDEIAFARRTWIRIGFRVVFDLFI